MPRPRAWAELVDRAETPGELEALRTSVARGRPFGDPRWTRMIADPLHPRFHPPPAGPTGAAHRSAKGVVTP